MIPLTTKLSVFILFLCLCCTTIAQNFHGAKDFGCFEKWLTGYRLAVGRPRRTFTGLTLQQCQTECERERGCGALAYGISGAANGTCELAIRSLRDSRSDTRTAANQTLAFDEIARHPQYDIYMMSPNCFQRQPLYTSGSSYAPIRGNGVPIDCFYRLMSGKRLAKNHVFRALSVPGLQECQEACIGDNHCRSISYRYMVSGTYSYNVANCELSPFYITNYEDTSRVKYDFVDDYDYDYFQREPHCKTTSRVGSFGVCAVIARRGAKLAPRLIKSTHRTTSSTQCEFLCQTASRFRCKAFALRHTTRGRDPFHRDTSYESVCTLYDVDISRLSRYDIEQDPDYDLYELGRLMGAECVLYDQYLNRRPHPDNTFKHTQYVPFDPERRDERYPPHRFPGRDRNPGHRDRYPVTTYLPTRRPYDYEYHPRRPGSHYYPPEQRGPPYETSFPRPGSTTTEISGSVTHGIGTSSFNNRPASTPSKYLPFYDPRREGA